MNAGTEGDLRLVGGGIDGNHPAAGVGILEVFHAGAWGTICNEFDLDANDYYSVLAEVRCCSAAA